MNWREHTWELVVSALSWIVALAVLAVLAIFVAVDASKRYWARRRARKLDSCQDVDRCKADVYAVIGAMRAS